MKELFIVRKYHREGNIYYQRVDIEDIYDAIYKQQTDIHLEINHIPYPEYRTIRVTQKENLLKSMVSAQKYFKPTSEEIQSLKTYYNINEDYTKEYIQFNIVKQSGGYRTITAPSENLKQLQRKLNDWLNHYSIHPHNNAFAFVKHRRTKDALMVHVKNKSNWFLKLDIKDFFPSCNESFIIQQFQKLYPLCAWSIENTKAFLEPCMLNNALPQGAVTSPLITNLIMIPIDYMLVKLLYNYNHHHYVYTRYADDILISCTEMFDPKKITHIVSEVLKDTPFKINEAKTRFGSKAGSNWNLGIMLNKDNKLSLGHKHKQRFRAAINNFIWDFTRKNYWEPHDASILLGQYSYFHSIEPEYAKHVMQHYQIKCGFPIKETIIGCIRGDYG